MPDLSRARLRRAAALGTRFLLIGGLSTLIEVAVFNLLVFVFGWDVVVSKVVASLVALINAYFGNRQVTFKDRDRRSRRQEILLFVIANAVCTALGAVLVWAGGALAELITGSAPGPILLNVINLFSIGVVVVARFGFYHLVVFRVPAAK